jgi:hypothetical protein
MLLGLKTRSEYNLQEEVLKYKRCGIFLDSLANNGTHCRWNLELTWVGGQRRSQLPVSGSRSGRSIRTRLRMRETFIDLPSSSSGECCDTAHVLLTRKASIGKRSIDDGSLNLKESHQPQH